MSNNTSSAAPANPDIKRELKSQLLALSARAFELFAGDFLPYVGLENVKVTKFVGDGGIDAVGSLVAGLFSIPIGIQVKQYKSNIPRPHIDSFIGALSGHFSQGLFMTTANYAPGALQKASSSIPRVMTLNGDQITSIMFRHNLGLRTLVSTRSQDIDPDYFAAFEAKKLILARKLRETQKNYNSSTVSESQMIIVNPEEDLISLNTLGYTLRVDPNRLRRWLDLGKLQADDQQKVGEHTNYYFRRDRIVQIRTTLELKANPASSDEWRQEFIDFARSRNLSKSYKPVMLKAVFELVNREGEVKIDDLVKEFRDFYIKRANAGLPIEIGASILKEPEKASNNAIKNLIVSMPLDRFLIKNYMEYSSERGVLSIAPQLWRDLRYYEVLDILESADEQINCYYSRGEKKGR